MRKLLLFAMLGVYALEDIKTKKVTVRFLPALGAVGILLQLCCKEITYWDMAGGVLIGGAVFALSVVCKGSIGKGDGFLLMVMGIYMGAVNNLSCFFLGLLYAAVWSLGVLVFLKKGRKWEIPFIPFLFAAYLTLLAGGSI